MPTTRPSPASCSKRRERALTAGFLALGITLGTGWLQLANSEEAGAPAKVKVDPAQVEEAWARGYALQKGKQTDAAIAAYEEALALDPDHVKSLYEVGWSYWVLGRWGDVVRVWERVMELQPDHPEVPKYLGDARAKQELTERLAAPSDATSAPPRADSKSVRLAFGGDTMMGSPLSNAGLPANDGAALFDAYRERMRAADVAFLNLEGVLLDSGRSYKCPEDSDAGCYAFRTPVRFGKNLADAGVDVVSYANNHVNDYGSEGRRSTLSELERLGIAAAGPLDREVLIEVNGTRVGYVGFATSPLGGDLRDIPLAQAMVRKMDEVADVVVVSFHGGAEGKGAQHVPPGRETFMGEDRGDLRAFTHAMVDAGADLVVGHGPHVLRGMEFHGERLIAYSLGNFVTYGGFNLSGENGLTVLLEVDLEPDGSFGGARIVPGRQVPPGGPKLDASGEAIRVIQALSNTDFPGSAPTFSDDGSLRP